MHLWITEIYLANCVLYLSVYGCHQLVSGALSSSHSLVWEFRHLSILVLAWAAKLSLNHGDSLSPSVDLQSLSLLKTVLILCCALCFILAPTYLHARQMHAFEYNLLCLLACLGLCLILVSENFLSFYLGIELQSLSLYALASFRRKSVFSTEAGLKYFILGGVASGLMALGICILYGSVGSLCFADLGQSLSAEASNFSQMGLYFVLFGLLFKLGVAPFHMWALDVYEGSPASVSLFFVTAPKFGVLLFLIKLLYASFYSMSFEWGILLAWVGLISVIVGGFGGYKQKSLKRLLVFSGIGHGGYLFLGILGGLELQNAYVCLFYLGVYILSSLLMWGGLMLWGSRKENRQLDLSSMVDLSLGKPLFGLGLSLVWFSLAGIPPFAGFFAKFLVLKAVVYQQMVIFALCLVFVSLASAFYYLRMIKLLVLDTQNRFAVKSRSCCLDINQAEAWVFSLSLSILVFFFLQPNLGLLATYKLSTYWFSA